MTEITPAGIVRAPPIGPRGNDPAGTDIYPLEEIAEAHETLAAAGSS